MKDIFNVHSGLPIGTKISIPNKYIYTHTKDFHKTSKLIQPKLIKSLWSYNKSSFKEHTRLSSFFFFFLFFFLFFILFRARICNVQNKLQQLLQKYTHINASNRHISKLIFKIYFKHSTLKLSRYFNPELITGVFLIGHNVSFLTSLLFVKTSLFALCFFNLI